jgi:hypothetical protein
MINRLEIFLMTEVKVKTTQHVEELCAINQRAFKMALSVYEDPSLRVQLSEEARFLRKRLIDVVEEIEQIDPAVRRQWMHQISESILDFNFVAEEGDISSLRLGDVFKWAK